MCPFQAGACGAQHRVKFINTWHWRFRDPSHLHLLGVFCVHGPFSLCAGRPVTTAAPLDPVCPLSPSAGAQAAIVFIKEPSSQDALQGRRALLRCEVEASGSVHVYWLLDGAPVQDTERRFAQGSSLSFAAVDRLQDSGAFQCVARDQATGEEARSANASFNIKCESWDSVSPCQAPSS